MAGRGYMKTRAPDTARSSRRRSYQDLVGVAVADPVITLACRGVTLPDLTSWNCFACGQDHPKGLRLRFTSPEQDHIRSEFTVSTDHVGLGRMVHGGIVATIFDEAMVWALYRWRYQPHVTAKMEQRFREAILADVPLIATAWISQETGSRRRVTAKITNAADPDRVLADARGLYLPAPASSLTALTEAQRADLEDLFAQFKSLDGLPDAGN